MVRTDCESIARARLLRSTAQRASGTARARSHGTAGSSGTAQCHIHTGYSSKVTPVRTHAAAAARPTASWSGCPSPRQVAAHHVRGAAPSRIPVSRSASRSSWSASRPSGRPSDSGLCNPRTFVALSSSSCRTASRRARSEIGAPGWAAPPSLTETTRTSTPAQVVAAVAPRPSVSSSGCGETTTKPAHPVRSSAGGRPADSADIQACTGVPPPSSGLAANRARFNSATQRVAPVRRDPALRGFAGCRWSGRRPAERADRPGSAGRVPGRGRCG